ncbi:transcriptional repressor general negative regulator of transcription subunit 4 [Coemansia guatemalensis]|uniref:Transcriptional repressor general negative regulator of transcription subunit 4 n=1 Tax=Coemansia guatemalensis TaxID=2761395 RepID=A0A9W8HVL4_9FUNG|nr:transcriptional repressor general negative regulator of transcription subunit 4 [Coemansia guatemalensis]
MSGSETEDWECPLCLEELDIDDRGFFPCECGYQICRFCHNRLSEDYGGRCPACRRLYSEQTPRWKPISPAQVARIKHEKKAKEREKREIESNSRRHLANVRVVQKNLVYVIGLPASLATEEILRSHDYFGQFGRINKIVINRRQNGSSAHHPTVGVYVTYAVKDDATRAINAVDGSMLESRVLRATFGTTKYCSYYLRNIPCQNPGCMYLHEPGEEADSFTKEDLAANGSRAEMKTGQQNEDETSERASSQSPGGQLGRVATAPAGGGSRPHNITHSSGAVQNGAVAAAGRGRRAQEANGGRPQTEDPQSTDSAGSALPATASWASRAMTKKANEAADGRGRKSEGSGAMTLRMVPASRNKAAKAAGNGTRGGGRAADVAASGASTQHHPMLQQMSRERKQQLRHQNRAQHKEAEAGAAAGDGGKKAGAAAEALPKQSHRAAKKAETPKETDKPPANEAADKQQTQQAKDEGQHAAEQVADNALAAETTPTATAAENELSDGGTTAGRAASSYASSALSFQTITDSLFEQLNAKVSTPTSSVALPAFGSGLGGHAMGVAGHPGASVDPMLFPPTANDAAHGLFGGAPAAQWADEAAASRSTFVQSPLSSLLGDSAVLGAPSDGMREQQQQQPGAARRHSRWGFARADEASAQAELQSVLGRGAVQPQLRPAAGDGPEFASSRDLGMFGTPVHSGYGGGPWGAAQARPQEAAAPFPPPGFGARQQRADTLPSDSGNALLSQLMGPAGLGVAASGLGAAAPGLGTVAPGFGAAASGSEGPLHGGFAQPQGLQDPAILTSHIAAPGMQDVAAGNQQRQQHQQQPALNSLLARLSLGRSETAPSLLHAQPFAQTAPFIHPSAASGFVDPAIMHVGRLDSLGGSTAAASVGPSSPTGPPPGITSPPAADSGGSAPQQQPGMVSRSANSSGRSRFLNHFESATATDPAGTWQHGASETRAPVPGNAVPPGLPTTGIFGELLRRAREDPRSGVAAAPGTAPETNEATAYAGGRQILDDLGHSLVSARREAQELQAKLSTVIGQSQSSMWVLAGAPQPAGDAPQPAAAAATSSAAGHRSAVSGM